MRVNSIGARFLCAVVFGLAAAACHREPQPQRPAGFERQLDAPPAAPDVAREGPAPGVASAALQVVAARPQGELEGLGRPTITFNKPVVALATLEQGEAANPARGFRLEPAQAGSWHWLGSTSVEFVPAAPLPLSSSFQVTVPHGLAALDGSRLAADFAFGFTTPVVASVGPFLEGQEQCRWAKSDQPFSVELNQPLADPAHAFSFELPGGAHVAAKLLRSVNVDDEKRSQRAQASDSPQRPRVEPASSEALGFKSQVTRYELQPATPLPAHSDFILALDVTAHAAQGPLTAKEGFGAKCKTFGEMKALALTRCESGDPSAHCSQGPIGITFSNPLGKIAELRSRLHIAPPVALDWDEQDENLGVELQELRTQVRIPAHWKAGQRYTISLDAGVKDEFGQSAGAFSAEVQLDDLTPSLFLGRDVGLLEASGDGLLPVQTTNVALLAADLWSLTPAEWLSLRTCQQKSCRTLPRPPDASPRTPLTDPKNESRLHGIDLRQVFKDGKKSGLVLVRTWAPNTASAEQPLQALIQVTDVVAHAKVGVSGGLVWVTSVESGQPLKGALVSVLAPGGAQTAQATSDENGLAILPPLGQLEPRPESKSWEEPRILVSASYQGDLGVVTTIWSDRSHDDMGAAFDGLTPVPLGSVFTDRGIYRPGDTVHVKGLLRRRAAGTPSGLSTPAGETLNLEVTDPDDKSILKKRVQLSPFGTFTSDVVAPTDGRLGDYRILVSPDGKERGGLGWSGSFTVAEYRAPTFRVDLLAGKKELLAGDAVQATVSARYLFGGAMKGAHAKWSVTRTFTPFSPSLDGYSFGRQTWGYDEGEPMPDSSLFAAGEGTIDGQGNLTIDAGKADAPGDRPATYTIEAEVQDVSRQTVAGRTQLLVHPASLYVGLGSSSLFVKTGEPVKLPVVAVDAVAGERASTRAGVEVKLTALLRAWHTVKKKGVGGVYESVSESVDEQASSCTVTTAATGGPAASCALQFDKPGFYTVRAEAKDAQGRLALSTVGIYALGPGFAAWARSDSSRVELVADKSEYAVGDVAHVLIKSPYPDCMALISVEREGIFSKRVTRLTGTAGSIDVPITEELLPNAFVGVVLQRGRILQGGIEPGEDPGRPAVKVGMVELRVGKASRKLSVSLQVPKEEWRPREQVPIELAVNDASGKPARAEVTVFAVDEGVLRLTDYQLPDLLAEMFPPRSSGVALGEPLLSLVRRQRFNEKGELQTGGGGGQGSSGSARSHFVTTALWTTVETDAQGHARSVLELPDNLTTFRIMAVALTEGDRFGTAQSQVRVSLPLLVLPALPRFARVGDQFEAGVVVNAKGLGAPQSEVKVTAQLSGPIALEPGQAAEQTVTVEEGVAREVRFKLVASGSGLAKLVFKASAPGAPGAGGPFGDGVEQQLPIELPTTLEAVAVYGETADKSVEGLLAPEAIRPGVGGLTLTLSSSALAGLADGMKQLVDYPYGCVEQLSSLLIPFIAIREVEKVFGVSAGRNAASAASADATNALLGYLTERDDGQTPADPDEVVRSTVKKIEALQAPSGGFRYFPSDADIDLWPSLYSALALQRAKQVGYAVTPAVLAKARAFAAQVASGTFELRGHSEPIAPVMRAFALQVLSRMGEPKPAYYDELYAGRDKLPLFGKALLADAMALGKGNPAKAKALLQEVLDHAQETAGEVHFAEVDSATYAPLFSSDVRTTGMALQTLVDLQPGHPFVGKIARYLSAVRKGSGAFRNTQEAAYALMGLTEVVRVRERTAPDFTAKIALGGKELLAQAFQGRSLALVHKTVPIDEVIAAAKAADSPSAPFTFAVDGQGLLEYGALLRYAPAKLPLTARDEGLFVQRWFEPYDSEGKTATTFAAGELVRVRVRVATRMERHYVAVEVPLPAGLEAVDLQLATAAHRAVVPHPEASEHESEEGYAANDSTEDDGSGWFYSPFNWSEKRDDRALYFANELPPGVHLQSFIARATTPGKFLLKPAQAGEMYTPEVFGRSEGGAITIVAQRPLAQK